MSDNDICEDGIAVYKAVWDNLLYTFVSGQEVCIGNGMILRRVEDLIRLSGAASGFTLTGIGRW